MNRKTAFLLSMVFSGAASANCEWRGLTFAQGEYVYSKDSELLSNMASILKSQGVDIGSARVVTDDAAAFGYTLRCTRSLAYDEAADALIPGDYVMVLAETHETLYLANTVQELKH